MKFFNKLRKSKTLRIVLGLVIFIPIGVFLFLLGRMLYLRLTSGEVLHVEYLSKQDFEGKREFMLGNVYLLDGNVFIVDNTHGLISEVTLQGVKESYRVARPLLASGIKSSNEIWLLEEGYPGLATMAIYNTVTNQYQPTSASLNLEDMADRSDIPKDLLKLKPSNDIIFINDTYFASLLSNKEFGDELLVMKQPASFEIKKPLDFGICAISDDFLRTEKITISIEECSDAVGVKDKYEVSLSDFGLEESQLNQYGRSVETLFYAENGLAVIRLSKWEYSNSTKSRAYVDEQLDKSIIVKGRNGYSKKINISKGNFVVDAVIKDNLIYLLEVSIQERQAFNIRVLFL